MENNIKPLSLNNSNNSSNSSRYSDNNRGKSLRKRHRHQDLRNFPKANRISGTRLGDAFNALLGRRGTDFVVPANILENFLNLSNSNRFTRNELNIDNRNRNELNIDNRNRNELVVSANPPSYHSPSSHHSPSSLASFQSLIRHPKHSSSSFNNKDLEQKHNSHDSLRSRYSRIKAENKELEEELEESNRKVSFFRRQSKGFIESKRKATSELSRKKLDYENLRESFKPLEDENRSLRSEISRVSAERSRILSDKERYREYTSREIRERSEELRHQERKNILLEKQLNDLRKKNDSLAKIVKRLSSSNEEKDNSLRERERKNELLILELNMRREREEYSRQTEEIAKEFSNLEMTNSEN